MSTDPRSPDALDDVTLSRRGLGKRLLLGASALAILLAAGKREEAQAAPVGDPWKLGGNAIDSDGTNFLGSTNSSPVIFKANGTERMRIKPSGAVGIGTPNPSAMLHSIAAGIHGILGETPSTASGATGVQGIVTSTAPGTDSAGVRGVNSGTHNSGAGVRGSHAGSGYGVQGTSVIGAGVHGTSEHGTGVFGTGKLYGLVGIAAGSFAAHGVYGVGDTSGVTGRSDALDGIGGYFRNAAGTDTDIEGVGVIGYGSGGGRDRTHPGGAYHDSGGEFSGPNGVIGAAAHRSGYGVIGIQGRGTLAMYAKGNMAVSGNLGVGGTKNFEIDHPLDPANKTLRHAAVESSEVKNMYDGVVTLDANGTATVMLPAWMEALNKDFRYQLTAIGVPAPNLFIADEISGNTFKIGGGKAGMKVSWLVTGIRNDKYMRQHPMEVESEKQGADRGKYLAPEIFGQSAEKGVGQQGQKRVLRPIPNAAPFGREP